jgi:hypothetical protein
VSSGGTNAYFGKRSRLTLGSWHQSPTLSAYFPDTTLASGIAQSQKLQAVVQNLHPFPNI